MTWAVLLVAFIIAEFFTTQLISIWFAAGSLAALICSLLDLSLAIQITVFIIVTVVMLAVTYPFIRKRLNTKHTATNNDLDIGKNATVIEEINHIKGTGRVTLNGIDWTAVPEDKNSVIPKGSIVVVKQVCGAKLVVALNEKSLSSSPQ